MLSRRQLRIKVLQSLYSFFQSEKSDIAVAERELFRSIEKVNELYYYLLLFLKEVAEADHSDAGDLHLKFFPRAEELKVNRRLFELDFIKSLSGNKSFQKQVSLLKLSWQNKHELVRKMFLEIKKSDEYRNFILEESSSEKNFVVELVRKFMESSEAFRNAIEEENIFWSDDFDFVIQQVIRTIRAFYDTGKLELVAAYRDPDDDTDFARRLFGQTIIHNEEFEKSIGERTRNWEVDRIALMDILIMKMALAELITFPNIPVKVTINEFIDISKEYSTPKSKKFVNGILDKLAADYKEKGKIVKAGRGLIN
jgi:transcription antitermination protein NusB